jgi:hypothetical protein
MSARAWYGIRWLDAVRAHPGRTRYACVAAGALAPYTDNATGEAAVSLARMADDTRQPPKALRRGFADLERLGLLERRKRRKEGSQEWETTLYRPRLHAGGQGSKRPTGTHGSKAAYGERPRNYTLSSVPETGSKRPTGNETHRSKRPTGKCPHGWVAGSGHCRECD